MTQDGDPELGHQIIRSEVKGGQGELGTKEQEGGRKGDPEPMELLG